MSLFRDLVLFCLRIFTVFLTLGFRILWICVFVDLSLWVLVAFSGQKKSLGFFHHGFDVELAGTWEHMGTSVMGVWANGT